MTVEAINTIFMKTGREGVHVNNLHLHYGLFLAVRQVSASKDSVANQFHPQTICSL